MMRTVFGLGLLLLATAIFSENQRVLETQGQDRNPLMFRIGSGTMFVLWECEKYLGDWDIIYVKYHRKNWVESRRGSWPFDSPYVNHHYPALAIRKEGEEICAFAQGPFPPSDTIGDNFFWATSFDTCLNWQVTWIINSDWFKDCSHLTAAAEGEEMFVVFEDNKSQTNPNIRSWYFMGNDPPYLVDLAVESNPEKNPFIAASSSGFTLAYESKSGSSWDIKGLKPSGTIVGEQFEIASDPSVDELHPYVAASGYYVYCAYRKGNDVYVAYSTDGGYTFTSVGVATSPQKEDWPAVACDEATVDVAYFHESGNILHRRSTDNGKTWSAPDTVTTQPTALDTPRIAMLFDNPCHIVWVDNRDGSPNLYYGRAAVTAVSEKEAAIPQVKISPNPFFKKAVIEYSNGTIEIYDALGRMVKKSNRQGPTVFDGSSLPAGVYFINYKNNTGITMSKKVVLLK